MSHLLELYINFKGEAKEAIAFYEDVFDTKCQNLMTFGEAPEDPEHPISDEIKDLVMNASIIIEGTYVMISDVPDMFGFEVTDEITFRSWLAQMMMKKLIAYLNDYLKVALLQCHYLKLFGPKSMVP